MKKIKLTLVLACFLIFGLLANGQKLWAKSKSSTFEMTSDVLCGTGGKSQSTTFALKVSVGAQASPIGKQSSTNFQASGGWVYTSEPSFMCGDLNGDGVINSADVVYLINYLFKGGPPPVPVEAAGDVNSDGVINSADVVYLINYLFKGGPAPCEGKDASPALSPTQLNSHLWRSQIGFSQAELQEGELGRLDDCLEIPIWGKFQLDLAAVELEIEYDPQEVTLLEPKLTSLTQGFSIFFGGEEGLQKIGIIDPTGKNLIPAGEGELLILSVGSIGKAKGKDLTSIQIKKAILVNREAKMLSVEISPNLQVETENAAVEIPNHFSLSQNHPNPFNPETMIKYALPQDCHVKLVIYNIVGQKVKTLVDEYQTAGSNTIHWNGRDDQGEEIATGVYFYKIQAGDFSQSRKMVLVK